MAEPRWRWLPAIDTWRYHLLLGAIGILILGPLGGVTASYMNFSHSSLNASARLRCMTPPPAPVARQPPQNGVGHHCRKRKIQQPRTLGHANLKTQA